MFKYDQEDTTVQAKRIPKQHLCHKHGHVSMAQVEAFPPGSHQGSCITPNLTCVRVELSCGCFKHFGVVRAWIDSHLTMCVEGGFVNPKNELVKDWENV